MYEYTIRPKTFLILDSRAIETMARNNVRYIHYSLRTEGNGDAVIVAKMPDNSEDMVLSRLWMKVNYGKTISTRIPKFLRDHVGKQVRCYSENITSEDLELFRIRPIGFSLNSQQKRHRATASVPYFTKSGSCVLPREYINKHIDKRAVMARLSFNMVNVAMVSEGNIYAYLTLRDEHGDLIYPLYPCPNGLRTRTPVRLVNFVASQGKDVSRFKYLGTTDYIGYEYGVIVFTEVERKHEGT